MLRGSVLFSFFFCLSGGGKFTTVVAVLFIFLSRSAVGFSSSIKIGKLWFYDAKTRWSWPGFGYQEFMLIHGSRFAKSDFIKKSVQGL